MEGSARMKRDLTNYLAARKEVAMKHEECVRVRVSIDEFFRDTICILQSGRPASCIRMEDAEHLFNTYVAAAESFVESARFAYELVEATVCEQRRLNSSIEPIVESVKSLAARAARAKEAGDFDELKAIRAECEPLRQTFENYKQAFEEEDQLFVELAPVKDALIEFDKMNQLSLLETQYDRIIELISPPSLPTLVLAAVSKPTLRDGVVGDAEEVFHKNLEDRGRHWANALYWADTIRSIGPLLVRFIIRLLAAYLLISR
jgi:hypothetical protein